MITTLILLCLSLLDLQQMPPVPDSLEKQFTVTELREQALTGCTSSPQAGRVVNHQIFVDYVGNDDPHDATTSVSALTAANYQATMENPNVPAMMPHNPPGLPNPNPNPETPPVAAVPEPSTLAILTISATVLLYLLFGRQRKQKLYRRN